MDRTAAGSRDSPESFASTSWSSKFLEIDSLHLSWKDRRPRRDCRGFLRRIATDHSSSHQTRLRGSTTPAAGDRRRCHRTNERQFCRLSPGSRRVQCEVESCWYRSECPFEFPAGYKRRVQDRLVVQAAAEIPR